MGQRQERREAREIANRMAEQGKSAAQIAQRIENRTNVSAPAAQNIASRVTSSAPSPPPSSQSRASSGPTIAGISVGQKIGANEYRQLLDKGLTASQIQQRAENKDLSFGTNARSLLNTGLNPAGSSSSPSSGDNTVLNKEDFESVFNDWAGSYFGGEAEGTQIPFTEYSLYPDVLQNQANVQAERIRQDGATERLKYEVDNKIPQIQAEAKGKIDLQKIVNAGYKNIANIERGTEMVRNITSMFNF